MGTLDAKKLLHHPVEQGILKWPSETVSRTGSASAYLSPASTFWFSASSPLPVQEGCHSSMHLDCFQTSHRGAEVGFSPVALFFDSEADLSQEPPGLAANVLDPDVSMATHDPGSK